MESIGNFYERIRTGKRNTTKTNALTGTQTQDLETEIPDNSMKYHYLTGVNKSFWERRCIIVWKLITIFVIVFTYDILFNYSRLFIWILLWTSR